MPNARKVVFAGKTETGKEIVLYVDEPNEKDFIWSRPSKRLPPRAEYLIKRPDGEVWALSPQATIIVWENEGETDVTHVRIESPEWSGTAKGTRADLIRAEGMSV